VELILVLLVSATFPVAGLGFLLWMARFEDRLPDAVRRRVRRPDPPPVLAIPVQRAQPAAERLRPQVPEGSRSVALPAASLGGSTNR
jgi:hypothetical protein